MEIAVVVAVRICNLLFVSFAFLAVIGWEMYQVQCEAERMHQCIVFVHTLSHARMPLCACLMKAADSACTGLSCASLARSSRLDHEAQLASSSWSQSQSLTTSISSQVILTRLQHTASTMWQLHGPLCVNHLLDASCLIR